MSHVSVKICGLSTADTVAAALEAGADHIGLVFFPKSPRFVDMATAARLANLARGRAAVVALVVDADDTLLTSIVEHVSPDMLQLHGRETPERAAEIGTRFGRRVWKAIGVSSADDATRALDFRGAVARILFDAKAPKDSAIPGGNGVVFDWRLLDAVKADVPNFILSGGLTIDNIGEAISATGATAVDVSSGVEIAPGIKDPARIRAFVAAAHGAQR